MPVWLQLFGRVHPMVLHLPIGLLIGMACVEAVALLRRRPAPQDATLTLALLAALTAVVTAASGLALSYEPGYSGNDVALHQYLGIAVAVGSVLTAIAHAFGAVRTWYRAFLGLTLIVMVPAGHLGASLTHGADFLFEPLKATSSTPPTANPPASAPASDNPLASRPPSYVADIAPIFAERCGACHGEKRARGRLALHEPDAIRKGGKHGTVLVAGKPGESDLVRRLRLDREDEDHMPPPDEPQLTDDEIAKIAAWIATGATFDGAPKAADEAAAPKNAPDAPAGSFATPREDALEPAPEEAIEALRRALVHVERAKPDSNELLVDFAVATKTPEAEILKLLAPLKRQLVDLSLSRCAVSDDALKELATFQNLKRLDLRATSVSTAGVAAIKDLPRLEELNLAQTRVDDTVVDAISEMSALKRLFAWRSSLSKDAAAHLSEVRKDLTVNVGEFADGAALETEPDLVFSGDAPLPGAPATPVAAATSAAPSDSASSLRPVNAVCPISGKPVDAKFAIVHEGRVIGFCCSNCAAQYWADPAKYVSQLK